VTTGLYFIANDHVYDLAIAFLNSIRIYEPLLPLCLIPYNDHSAQIVALANEYQFTVWQDRDTLRRCDAISKQFHGAVLGQYRKLAIWEGLYDQFAYIDVDTVLLNGIDIPLKMLDDFDFLTATSDLPAIRKYVWKDSLPPSAQAVDSKYAANTGILFSKREMLTMANIERKLDEALQLAPYMELKCAEQALLNYLIVTSGRRYSSLSRICRERNRKDIPQAVWSGDFDGDLLKRRLPALVLHWAGQWQGGEHLTSPVWRYFRHSRDDCR
jgi:hypothetical protein